MARFLGIALLCLMAIFIYSLPLVSGGQAQASASGLANSPWPMFRHDLQHTGRSVYSVPIKTPICKWTYSTDGIIHSSPAVGQDGTIYFGSRDNCVYAITPNGSLRWKYQTGDFVTSSPLIGSDGTIYIGSWDTNLYAINPDGSLKWQFTTGSRIYSSPAIGADGTLYVGSLDNNLYAIDHNGSLKWKYTTSGSVGSSPAIASDGIIYVGSDDGYLYAINPNGSLKWSYATSGHIDSGPAISTDNTIYFGSWDHNIYALNSDGSLKWSYTTGDGFSSPAIGADGTIYIGCWDNNIYAFTPDGSLRWSFRTGHLVSSSPTIAADGSIYVGSYDAKLYALDPNGSLKWTYDAGGSFHHSCPVISADGSIYIGSEDGKLYAIGEVPPTTTTTPTLLPTVAPTPTPQPVSGGVIVPTPTPAGQEQTITLNPSSGGRGAQVSVTASSFAPHAILITKFDEETLTTTPPVVETDDNGNAAFTILIPPIGGGVHPITVSDGSRTATQRYVVIQGMNMDSSKGPPSSTVSISVIGFLPNIDLTVTFDGAYAQTVPVSPKTDASGQVEFVLVVPDATVGLHSITVSDGASQGTMKMDYAVTPGPNHIPIYAGVSGFAFVLMVASSSVLIFRWRRKRAEKQLIEKLKAEIIQMIEKGLRGK